MTADVAKPFWETLPLDQMTGQQWESLCDGCGLCCLHKLEDEDDGEIYYTDVACRLLDTATCRCQQYADRALNVEQCMVLTPDNLAQSLRWLPDTCAYKLLAQKKLLPVWHPLMNGNNGGDCVVHAAGISARGRCISESQVDADRLDERVVYWVSGFGE